MTRKVALVTGGSRGIGAAVARRLADDGFDVAITYLSAGDRAAAVVKEAEAAGGRALDEVDRLLAVHARASFMLAQAAAWHMGPRGITANLVNPGSTDTDMNPAGAPEADDERRYTALGTYCSPGDIAAAVAHLAGEGGRHITGASIAVDAGVTA